MKNKFLILSLLVGTLKTISPMDSWIEWGIGEGEVQTDWKNSKENLHKYPQGPLFSEDTPLTTHLSEISARFNLALFLQTCEHRKLSKQIEKLAKDYKSNQREQDVLENDLFLDPSDKTKQYRLLDLKRNQRKIYDQYVALCLETEQPLEI